MPVREIGYFDTGKSTAIVFRNGYPAIDKNDTLSFYEVMVNGSLVLLKRHAKILRQVTPVTGITSYSLDDASLLYLFDKNTNAIKGVKRNKESILSVLPAEKQALCGKLFEENNFNLKHDKDIVTVFEKINRN